MNTQSVVPAWLFYSLLAVYGFYFVNSVGRAYLDIHLIGILRNSSEHGRMIPEVLFQVRTGLTLWLFYCLYRAQQLNFEKSSANRMTPIAEVSKPIPDCTGELNPGLVKGPKGVKVNLSPSCQQLRCTEMITVHHVETSAPTNLRWHHRTRLIIIAGCERCCSPVLGIVRH